MCRGSARGFALSWVTASFRVTEPEGALRPVWVSDWAEGLEVCRESSALGWTTPVWPTALGTTRGERLPEFTVGRTEPRAGVLPPMLMLEPVFRLPLLRPAPAAPVPVLPTPPTSTTGVTIPPAQAAEATKEDMRRQTRALGFMVKIV